MAKEYVKRVRNTWTEPEEATLRSGQIPETRTYSQAYLKAKLLGIPPSAVAHRAPQVDAR